MGVTSRQNGYALGPSLFTNASCKQNTQQRFMFDVKFDRWQHGAEINSHAGFLSLVLLIDLLNISPAESNIKSYFWCCYFLFICMETYLVNA